MTEALKTENIGKVKETINVELGASFLEHFSEQLYSSPQKAFEELISNGWDAGASFVDVWIDDLASEKATMCVFDNGESMDLEGLRRLWNIARSPKKGVESAHGRPVIGKFGIGKLATYVLANHLTYICKASDGVIRRVTMDYHDVEDEANGEQKLLRDIDLKVYEVSEKDLDAALDEIHGGSKIKEWIGGGVPTPSDLPDQNEFGEEQELEIDSSSTWTLVVLSDLKEVGQSLKIGILKRMLSQVLPLGSTMYIAVNGEQLLPSKSDASTFWDVKIGPELKLGEVKIPAPTEQDPDATEVIPIKSGTTGGPHVEIPGIGRVSGRVRLFKDKISGLKSEEIGVSNGFHVNVLGRVVNIDDPSFGEKDLSHAAWARFRMAVRADGLNSLLITNREKFKERRELIIFRAFLRRVFNLARGQYDSDSNVSMPDGGDVLVRSLGVPSLNPLRNVVSEILGGEEHLPSVFDLEGVDDTQATKIVWQDETSEDIRNALGTVKFENLPSDEFVRYRVTDKSLVVNSRHPFALENSRTKVQKELLRTVAMIEFLTDIYSIDAGVNRSQLRDIRAYRDKLMRYRALQNRESGMHLAELLLETQNDANWRLLEKAVSDALRYIGFEVQELGKPGHPEGLAKANPLPGKPGNSDGEGKTQYAFTFDAKSTKHDKAKSGNIDIAAISRHRKKYGADYALVIAPGYQAGDIDDSFAENLVCPITAHDLGVLLSLTVDHGAIPLSKLQEMFLLYTPTETEAWVKELSTWLPAQRTLSYSDLLKALEELKGQIPDALPSSTIALTIRRQLGVDNVLDEHVLAVAQGLQILVPDLVGVEGDKIIVNASAQRVAAAVESQLEAFHQSTGES